MLYGEGFGAGIQKGGGAYGTEQRFILFDVQCGRWWLERPNLEAIAHELHIPMVPTVGVGTLAHFVDVVRAGFMSSIASDATMAEGLVARPLQELKDRAGKRVIVKLKTRDFQEGKYS